MATHAPKVFTRLLSHTHPPNERVLNSSQRLTHLKKQFVPPKEDPWPWQMAYAGYLGMFLSVPLTTLAAVYNWDWLRYGIFGGPAVDGRPGDTTPSFSYVINLLRNNYGEVDRNYVDVGGEIAAFESSKKWFEHEEKLKIRKSMDFERDQLASPSVYINGVVFGPESERKVVVRAASTSPVGTTVDLAKGEILVQVEFPDIEENEGGDPDIEEEADTAMKMQQRVLTNFFSNKTPFHLIHTFSMWHQASSSAIVGTGATGVSTSSSSSSSTTPSKPSSKEEKKQITQEIDGKIAFLNASMKDPANTREIDSIVDEIKQLESERKKIGGSWW